MSEADLLDEYWSIRVRKERYLPTIKFLDRFCTERVENAHEMGEKGLPHPEFKLVHDVDNQGVEYIKLDSETF